MKKLISLVLACALVVTMFVGCGKKADSNTGNNTAAQNKVPDYMNATEFPVVKQPITVKVMGSRAPDSGEWKDLVLFKKMEEITGIHLEFDTPVSTGYTEKKNLVLASNDVPDVFIGGGITAKDEETYGPQGLFAPIEGYIDQYAPHVKKAFDKYPAAKSASVATDGHIYSLPYIVQTLTTAANIIYINMDWLKKVNMSKPATTDEFYNVLKAFRDKDANGNGKPDEMGLSYWKQTSPISGVPYNVFLAAFSGQAGGVNFDVKEDGKTVVYNPQESYFRDYLEYMNKLYKDGLLDPEMFSQSMQQYIAKYKEGTMGVSTITLSSIIDPKATFNYELLPPLTSAKNSKKVTAELPGITTGTFVITNKCKYPEAMMRWIDILYREDDDAVQGVSGLTNFLGVYGDTWTYSDSSKKTYVRASKDPQLTPVQYVTKNIAPQGFGLVVTMAYPDKTQDPLLLTKATESEKNYHPYMVPVYPTTIRYSGDANDRVALLENDITTFVGQEMAKFITGEEPLSNWNTYLDKLKQLHIDELLKLRQDAYDKWKAGAGK